MKKSEQSASLTPEQTSLAQDRVQIKIPDNLSGQRLDQACAALFPQHSRTRLKQLIEQGQVQLDGKSEDRPKRKVSSGQVIDIQVPQAVAIDHMAAENIPLDIVYEDAHLLVVNKPAGMVVHPAVGNYSGTLVNALLHHCKGNLAGIGGELRPGIVHRIDKETSGLLVVAKDETSMRHLQQQLKHHSMERCYDAFVWGTPPSQGRVDKPLGRSPNNRLKMAVVSEEQGKEARTDFVRLAALGLNAAWVECRLATGRTHQIRVHMSEIGFSLIGDPLYSKAPPLRRRSYTEAQNQVIDRFSRQALHARSLGFEHPISGEWLSFERSCPDDMQQLAETMAGMKFEKLELITSDFRAQINEREQHKRERELAEYQDYMRRLEEDDFDGWWDEDLND